MCNSDLSPLVLCIGGHDPSGGAGIQADAEAVRAAGLHAATIVTCLTAQDTRGLKGLWPQPPDSVADQCRLILADSLVKVIKIGLIGSTALARWLCQLGDDYPRLPLILDPVLAAGAGQKIADATLFDQAEYNLIGRCTLVTPNLPEARALSGAQDPAGCAERILARGCEWVLITGTHDRSPDVINRLYGMDGSERAWRWPRLPHEYHGSGCTLASAIAARLGLGQPMAEAVQEAQAYTWQSLKTAIRTGQGQWTPNRLYALKGPDDPIFHSPRS